MRCAALSENVPSSMCKVCRFTQSSSCTRSHPGLFSPLIRSIVSNRSCSGQQGPDQTAHSRSLIWAFDVRACPEVTSSLGAADIDTEWHAQTQ